MWYNNYYTSHPTSPFNPTDLPGRWMREGEGVSQIDIGLPPDANVQVKITPQDNQIEDMQNIAL